MKPKNFKDAEQAKGLSQTLDSFGSLPDWYHAKRDVPFSEFTEGDLCICVRQKVFLEYVMPYALKALIHNPLAGELYDGELVSALVGVPNLNEYVIGFEKKQIINALSENMDKIGSDQKNVFMALVQRIS